MYVAQRNYIEFLKIKPQPPSSMDFGKICSYVEAEGCLKMGEVGEMKRMTESSSIVVSVLE